MSARQTMSDMPSLIETLLGRKGYEPDEPRTLEQAGLTDLLVDALICKQVKALGSASGRSVAEHLCLPYGLVEDRFQKLRSRQILSHRGSAPLNDYVYMLTE
ncbi:MAG TPA: hypothetical protein VGY58_23630, partial [Gemmataceae bacterium]|nr:hypothetical protein [Gemmataceae bacterium]